MDEYSRDHESERAQAARRLGGSAGGSLIMFRPRRWRVFVLMFVAVSAGFVCIGAILYAGRGRPIWWEGQVFFACAYAVSIAGLHAWRAPRNYAVSVSDTEISGGSRYPGAARTIPLADLDRVRSARRTPIDRLLGEQRLYSTSDKRLYLWRAVFDSSDFRKLLDLLQLDQGHMS